MKEAGQRQKNRKKDKKEKYYKGRPYAWKTPRKQGMRMLWQFSGISLASEIAAGFVPGVGIGSRAWILLPYIGSMVFAVIVFWTVIRISRGGDPIHAFEYGKSVEKLPFRALWLAICSGIDILGEAINLIWRSQFIGSTEGAVMYMLLHLLAFYCSIQLRVILSNGVIQFEPKLYRGDDKQ